MCVVGVSDAEHSQVEASLTLGIDILVSHLTDILAAIHLDFVVLNTRLNVLQ